MVLISVSDGHMTGADALSCVGVLKNHEPRACEELIKKVKVRTFTSVSYLIKMIHDLNNLEVSNRYLEFKDRRPRHSATTHSLVITHHKWEECIKHNIERKELDQLCIKSPHLILWTTKPKHASHRINRLIFIYSSQTTDPNILTLRLIIYIY